MYNILTEDARELDILTIVLRTLLTTALVAYFVTSQTAQIFLKALRQTELVIVSEDLPWI